MRIFSAYAHLLLLSHVQGLAALNFDFWQSAKDLSDKANAILKDVAAEYAIADKINDLERSMNQVVTSAETLAEMILEHVPSLDSKSSQGLVAPDFDFWQSAKDLGDKANAYKDKILKDATAEYASIADKINDVEESMNQVVTSAETLAKMILEHVPSLEEFQNRFEVERSRAWETLRKEFSEPLPEDQTERYKQQAIRISQALNMTEDALVKVCGLQAEADVRTEFENIKPHIRKALLILINLVNNHPVLFETFLFAVVLPIIPRSFVLRSILSLLGFGPSGPVKGSLAASAQRFFFGAAVTEGSWFAMLQRVGMKIDERRTFKTKL